MELQEDQIVVTNACKTYPNVNYVGIIPRICFLLEVLAGSMAFFGPFGPLIFSAAEHVH